MFLFLPRCTLGIFATGKGNTSTTEVKVDWKFRLIWTFRTWKVTKLAKKWQKSKFKRNCETLSNVKCVQTSYKKCPTWPDTGRSAMERSVLHDNVNWGLEMSAVVSTTTSLWFCYENFTFISSVPEKSARFREVSAIKDENLGKNFKSDHVTCI